jgi:hypothetical protein
MAPFRSQLIVPPRRTVFHGPWAEATTQRLFFSHGTRRRPIAFVRQRTNGGWRVSRVSAEHYRSRAQLCLDIARSLPHGSTRSTLVDAAQTFLELAEEQGPVVSQQQQQNNKERNALAEIRRLQL